MNCLNCSNTSLLVTDADQDILTSDLDFDVLDANGNVIARSWSFDNNYEIVDFATGTHPQPFVIQLKAFGPRNFEVVGLASVSYNPTTQSP